jgi:hypothetical protein
MNHPDCRYCGVLIEWIRAANEWRDADGDAVCPDAPDSDKASRHYPKALEVINITS